MNAPQNLKDDQNSSETKITKEPQILKDGQISNETQITIKNHYKNLKI